MAMNVTHCPAWQDFPDIELYMDQVISVLDRALSPYSQEEKCITSTMINNYVKSKILLPPQNKRYHRAQLARLFMICLLKRFMQLSEIGRLLENLAARRSEEEVYSLFASELDLAMSVAYDRREEDAPAPAGKTEEALRSALFAFAAMHRARTDYLAAEQSWPRVLTEDEVKAQEKKAKEKEKEKEKKAKEKEKDKEKKAKEKKKEKKN